MSPLRILEPENPEKRDTALLTTNHREYLTDIKEELSTEHENQLRLRLRKRVKNGIQDFRQIRRLSDKDKKLIFSGVTTSSPLTEGIVHTLAFLYEGTAKYTNMDFSSLLEAAIETVETERLQNSDYSVSSVEVVINTSYCETLPNETLRKRLNQGEKLTDREIGRLVRSGDLTIEDINRLGNKTDEAKSEPPEKGVGTNLLTLVDYSDAETN